MPLQASPTSPRHRGWFLDQVNGRLAAYYDGTKAFDFDANDMVIPQALSISGALTAQDVTLEGTLAATGDAGAAGAATNGDALTLTAGAGSSTTAAATAPGVGGAITITAGAGGASTDDCDTAGAGGAITIAAGAGGAATGCGSTGGAAGVVTIRLPTAVNCGAAGRLQILNTTTGVGVTTGTTASPVNAGAGNVWGNTALQACCALIPANNAVLMIETT